MTRIKFCGFTRSADVDYANALGVDLAGFVRHRKSARYVTLATARELAARLNGPQPVLVHRWQVRPDRLEGAWYQAESFGRWSSWGDPPRIVVVRADPFQVPTGVPPQVADILRHNFAYDLGNQVVTPATMLEGIKAILVDAFVPGVGGGTGVRVNLEWAAAFASRSAHPIILAGGLTPDNVAEAIRMVRPYAVDVSSGIESSPGIKDHGKMKAFVEAVRGSE